jgi:phosphoribosyl 1,2-cyclic phosphodiesterase
MQLRFLGTRGYIKIHSKLHLMHSSLLVTHRNKRIMIDCGEDWRKEVWKIKPDAIIITHGHPDHAWGLADGAPAPVYASTETWQLINAYPIQDRHTVHPRKPFTLLGVTIEAFSVHHSIRCPAIGYRISSGTKTFFYISDVVDIDDRHAALSGVDLYIGDGASVTRPLVRRKGDIVFGHTTIRAQIGWCGQEGVPRAVFTHCGTQIVSADSKSIDQQIRSLGAEKGVESLIAYDNMELTL